MFIGGLAPAGEVQGSREGGEMIDLILRDAVERVEFLKAEYPEVFGEFQRDIDAVKEQMQRLANRIPQYESRERWV